MGMTNNNDFIADVLYREAIKEEKEWRKDKKNSHDIKIIDEILKNARELGYGYKYFTDITNRDNTDIELLKLLLRYIGRFKDEWYSVALVRVIARKGNDFATDTIINHYINSSLENKSIHACFYDNALSTIKDKRYVSAYLNFLKNPSEATKFPKTMIMLGQWRIAEARTYFLKYINLIDLDDNHKWRTLVSVAIQALGYYNDDDGVILKALEGKINMDDTIISSAVRKSMKKIKRQRDV